MADVLLQNLTLRNSLVVLSDDLTYDARAVGDDFLDHYSPVGWLLGARPLEPGGRLTLTSGVPVPAEDVIDGEVIYYTVYQHELVSTVNSDGVFATRRLSSDNLSLVLNGMTEGALYDVFISYNEDDEVHELSKGAAWTNATTRSQALTRRNGLRVLASDPTKLFLGTFCATGEDTTSDAAGDATSRVFGKRLLANEFHQVARPLVLRDDTGVSVPGYLYGDVSASSTTLPAWLWPSYQMNQIVGRKTNEFDWGPDGTIAGGYMPDWDSVWKLEFVTLGNGCAAVDLHFRTEAMSGAALGGPYFGIALDDTQSQVSGTPPSFTDLNYDWSGTLLKGPSVADRKTHMQLRQRIAWESDGYHVIHPVVRGLVTASGSATAAGIGENTGASATSQLNSGLHAMIVQ